MSFLAVTRVGTHHTMLTLEWARYFTHWRTTPQRHMPWRSDELASGSRGVLCSYSGKVNASAQETSAGCRLDNITLAADGGKGNSI